MALAQVNAATFDTEVKKASGPVVVKFYGTTWPPCKKLLPIVEEVAGEFAGKAKFVKVNIEDSDAEEVAVNYGVYAVPTLLFFKAGEPVDKLMGLVAKPKLVERVNALLQG